MEDIEIDYGIGEPSHYMFSDQLDPFDFKFENKESSSESSEEQLVSLNDSSSEDESSSDVDQLPQGDIETGQVALSDSEEEQSGMSPEPMVARIMKTEAGLND